MFAAQYGWWLVTPDKSEQPRHEMYDAFDLPDLPPSETLHEVWRELGACGHLFDGTAVPFDWREMQAYSGLMAAELSPIGWKTLRDMSQAYAEALRDKSPFSIPPMDREGVTDDG